MNQGPLDGLSVLVMEDEFLIAMDVEQLCREYGAADVVLAQSLAALDPDPFSGASFHVAILDVRLAGRTTIEFAGQLLRRGIPFIFATGYVDNDELFADTGDLFRDVEIVTKPYAGEALIDALVRAIARAPRPENA